MDAPCSLQAHKVPHQICASIEHRSHQLFIELPEPWERVFGLSEHFPPKLLNALQHFAKTLPNTSVSVFAPDAEYSSPDGLRIIYLRYDKAKLSYDTFEGVVLPEKLSELVMGTPDCPLSKSPFPRDFFICAHAKRDHCCGVFGLELYEALRKDPQIKNANVRIFKCSHIGGHRYAPSMIEVPTLNCWGQLTFEAARQIVLREGDIESVVEHYRGSASMTSPYFQIAEKVLLRKYGWDWFSFANKSFSGEVRADQNRVYANFTSKESPKEHYSFDIASLDPIMLRANCDEEKINAFPQYRVLNVEANGL